MRMPSLQFLGGGACGQQLGQSLHLAGGGLLGHPPAACHCCRVPTVCCTVNAVMMPTHIEAVACAEEPEKVRLSRRTRALQRLHCLIPMTVAGCLARSGPVRSLHCRGHGKPLLLCSTSAAAALLLL